MSTSHSSSSLSSALAVSKPNLRRLGGLPPSKAKPTATSIPSADSQPSTVEHEEEDNLPVTEPELDASEPTPLAVESLPADAPVPTITKREQQVLDEQEYQRKLTQKIREAQQRREVERQREEEQQRQLEVEEHEREQEQIRLVEEQRRAEQDRLQRAIDECDRETELKRQEEQRVQQQREELEKRQAEEAERLSRERQERAKKEEDERNERKKRLDLIMRRTRQASPNSKVNRPSHKLTLIHLFSHPAGEQDHGRAEQRARIRSFLFHGSLLTHTSFHIRQPFSFVLVDRTSSRARFNRHSRCTDRAQVNPELSPMHSPTLVSAGSNLH